MSCYLITGATGFIGSHLTEMLVARGDTVRCLIRETSDISLLAPLGVEFVTGSFNDREFLREVVSGVDAVIHLAGQTTAFALSDLLRVNRDATYFLAEACASQATPPVHVVVSSIAAAGPVARNQVRMEYDAPRPVSNYGFSKRAGECAALLFADRVATSIVRPGMVFGERNTEMFPIFQSMAKMGSHVVLGPATPRVSLIHVADLCELLVRVAERGQRITVDEKLQAVSGDGIYFGVCDEAPSYARLGSILKRMIGKRGARQATLPSPLTWLLGGTVEVFARMLDRKMAFNLDKIREAQCESWECSVENVINDLEYEFPIRLKSRLEQTYRWYVNNHWLKETPRPSA